MTDKQPIDALILGGGGVKGLALAGAVIELERFHTFDTFVGTSAGAIAAVLLAAGYGGDDLRDELEELDTGSMVDGWVRAGWNLATQGGLQSGRQIRDWVARKLADRLYPASLLASTNVMMNQLPHRAVVYAADASGGAVTFDSRGEHDDTYVDAAVRCSISIPGFFVPADRDVGGRFDGGLLNSFPAKIFLEKNPGASIIGVYLTSKQERRGRPPRIGLFQVLAQTVRIYLGGDEPRILRELKDKIVAVDTSPINTLDFNLSRPEKNLLVLRGRIAARHYLADQGKIPAHDSRLKSLLARAETVGAQVELRRRRRRLGRLTRLSAGVIAAVGVLALYRHPPAISVPPFHVRLASGTLQFVPDAKSETSGTGATAAAPPTSLAPARHASGDSHAPAVKPAPPLVENRAAPVQAADIGRAANRRTDAVTPRVEERVSAHVQPQPTATVEVAASAVPPPDARGTAVDPLPSSQWRSSGVASSMRAAGPRSGDNNRR